MNVWLSHEGVTPLYTADGICKCLLCSGGIARCGSFFCPILTGCVSLICTRDDKKG
jgi:hypothetical protein